MKTYRCDKCGKDVGDAMRLNTLTKDCQVGGIKDLCDECYSPIEKVFWSIKAKHLKAADAEIRAMIGGMKPIPETGLWARMKSWWNKPFGQGVRMKEWLTPDEQIAAEADDASFQHYYRIAHGRQFFAQQVRHIAIALPVGILIVAIMLSSR